ncbi:plastocyanin/azurin family copper-binding protein [Azospira restricta]|uniref:Cupredoxin domain-containing protein n=2 Tax=Azospira restricta TaxID=404405 RepID=A0A974SSP2_9RHOO|nr:cupredoxin domain-containing protein [Azospira restricta]
MRRLSIALLFALPFGTATAETVEVRIEKYKFVPEEIKIKAGDTVVWKSYEKRGYHTVWFKERGLPESEPMFPDESWQMKFETQGEHPYVCGPHPEMTGRVIVE